MSSGKGTASYALVSLAEWRYFRSAKSAPSPLLRTRGFRRVLAGLHSALQRDKRAWAFAS